MMQAFSTAADQSIACPQCGVALLAAHIEPSIPFRCPGCRSTLEAFTFPSFRRAAIPFPNLKERVSEGEAACFFHMDRKAAVSCERCGRFICELCEMPIGGHLLCPKCLEANLSGEKIPELVTRRICWAKLAFYLGGVPLVIGLPFWPALVFSGAAAIFCAIYGWNKPGSVVRGRRRWVAVVGAICGLTQIVIWLGIVGLISIGFLGDVWNG